MRWTRGSMLSDRRATDTQATLGRNGRDLSATGVSSDSEDARPSLSHASSGNISPRDLPVSCPLHCPPEAMFEPLGNGEMVVRFFGLKDVDNYVTGVNVLPSTLQMRATLRWSSDSHVRTIAPIFPTCSGSGIFSEVSGVLRTSKLRVHLGFWRMYKVRAICWRAILSLTSADHLLAHS